MAVGWMQVRPRETADGALLCKGPRPWLLTTRGRYCCRQPTLLLLSYCSGGSGEEDAEAAIVLFSHQTRPHPIWHNLFESARRI
eukprot:COSAG01_NODE_4718_length_4794_cov_363.209585_2_plen_84_part_00